MNIADAASVGTPDIDDAVSAPPTGHVIEDATAAARRVMESLLRTSRDNPNLASLRDRLHEIADLLDAHAPDLGERLVEMWAGGGSNRHDPVSGAENPIAAPFYLRGREDGSISATAILGLPYQGPPSMVHGGISALVLDHALGCANGYAGPSGMTAELTVRYHRVTPLFEPLTVTARQVSVDGRKIRTTGELTTSDGTVCVSAEGLFIAGHLDRPRAD
ncbi:MAG: PaaI family thioesterase [Nocardiaceae bacterium]|nr:PaaI family thioesterase [Nocardiaceae bacterium]